jgi:hypothetical protein
MRQKTFVALAGFLALLIFSPLTAYGTGQLSPGTYYVDINQTSEGDGTAGTPWRTLHNAISQINGGEVGSYTLNVAAGTYIFDADKEADASLTITKDNVTIQGDGPGSTILDGTGAESWSTGIGTISASNGIIKDMEIRYFSCYGISIYAGSGNVIQGCEIHNNNSGGILVENSSPYIKQNEIYDNYSYGIYVDDCSQTASPDIWNNLIYDTGGNMNYGIYLISGYGVMSVEPRIYHNTIDGGVNDGIYIDGYMGYNAPDIQYNIITNFSQYGINNNGGSPAIDYNDVWHNGQAEPYDQNYSGCEGWVGDNDISEDPSYVGSGDYHLQPGSLCIDKIPTADPPGDTVEIDYAGYERPKGSGYDMGAYEYIPNIVHDFSLPGGTGDPTDYRMFTVPVTLESGSSFQESMENVLGPYDKGIWRVFAWDAALSAYIEMDEPSFADLAVYPGRGFWVISTVTDTVTFSGQPAPDGEYAEVPLFPGWNMVALPWPGTPIELDKIAVSDGLNTFFVTSNANTLTQQYVWDYTGTGTNGYQQLGSGATLQPSTAYWIKVLGTAELTMLVPKDSAGPYFTARSLRAASRAFRALEDTEQPPPPPGISVNFESTSSDGGTTVSGSAGCFIDTVTPRE